MLLSKILLLALLFCAASSVPQFAAYKAPPPPPISTGVAFNTSFGVKRGLSGLNSCGDARALSLDGSWHYNWGFWPTSTDAGGNEVAGGTMICNPPMSAEFVPMFWGCW